MTKYFFNTLLNIKLSKSVHFWYCMGKLYTKQEGCHGVGQDLELYIYVFLKKYCHHSTGKELVFLVNVCSQGGREYLTETVWTSCHWGSSLPRTQHPSPIWPYIVPLSTRVAILNGGLTKLSIWYRAHCVFRSSEEEPFSSKIFD